MKPSPQVPFAYKVYPHKGYILELPYAYFAGIDRDAEAEWVTLEDGVLYLKVGYQWNGANKVPDRPSNVRSSCVHDALYQLIALGLLPVSCRKRADALYREIALEDGMEGWRARLHYYTLRFVWTFIDLKDRVIRV